MMVFSNGVNVDDDVDMSVRVVGHLSLMRPPMRICASVGNRSLIGWEGWLGGWVGGLVGWARWLGGYVGWLGGWVDWANWLSESVGGRFLLAILFHYYHFFFKIANTRALISFKTLFGILPPPSTEDNSSHLVTELHLTNPPPHT